MGLQLQTAVSAILCRQQLIPEQQSMEHFVTHEMGDWPADAALTSPDWPLAARRAMQWVPVCHGEVSIP